MLESLSNLMFGNRVKILSNAIDRYSMPPLFDVKSNVSDSKLVIGKSASKRLA